MLILGQVRVRLAPTGLGKRFSKGHAAARIRRRKNEKYGGGVICAPRTKHGIVPVNF